MSTVGKDSVDSGVREQYPAQCTYILMAVALAILELHRNSFEWESNRKVYKDWAQAARAWSVPIFQGINRCLADSWIARRAIGIGEAVVAFEKKTWAVISRRREHRVRPTIIG